MILDEPTNHLDIDSRAALIEAINDYAGAVVLISHDRYLIDACADRLWLVADGTVAPFDGDLDEYRRRVLSDRRDEPGGADKARRGYASRACHAPISAARRPSGAPSWRRCVSVSCAPKRRSSALTQEIAKLDTALAQPNLYDDPARATGLAKARAEAAEALAAAEADWLTASTEYESAMAEA